MKLGDPLGEAEQAPIDAGPVSRPHMVGLCLVGVADVLGLCSREVATLLGDQIKQPAAKVPAIGEHVAILYQNLSISVAYRLKLKFSLRIKPHRAAHPASQPPA